MAAAMSPFEMPSSFATGFLPWYLCGMKPTSAYDTTERQNRQKLMPTRDEFFVSIGGLGGTKIKCVDPSTYWMKLVSASIERNDTPPRCIG
jgi:hypothetical protein